MRDRRSFVLASFEAHFSKGDIRDMLAVEDGKRVPVEQGNIVPRYLLTKQLNWLFFMRGSVWRKH